MQHQMALKIILQYLSGTKTYGITYKDIERLPVSFLGYADAAYKNRDDNKSTTGYVFIAAAGAITWQSSRQSMTAESSTEAEYIALWEASKEASWLRNLYNELGFTQTEPTIIIQDNTGMVAIAKNPMFHKHTKHIDSHFHWIREKIQDGRLDTNICRTEEQTADILTKSLACPKHEKHHKAMGLSPV
jgi:hypothetical protein